MSISPDPPSKKGINKDYKDFVQIFSLIFRDSKLRLEAFPGGPGGFRELREASRKHFHLSWYLLVPRDECRNMHVSKRVLRRNIYHMISCVADLHVLPC